MTEPAYSRLPRERRVADIMRAARSVFDEKGYDAASVAEIAARAGVVEGSVYRYFEHKRALLVEVVERWYEELLADYDEHLAAIDGTWDRLRYLVWRHLSTIQKQPRLVRLVFEELRPGADYRETCVFRLNRAYTRRTLDILREGVARGEIRGEVSLAVARDMIYGGVEHHTWGYVRGEAAFSPDVTADAIIEILRAGIGTPQPAAQPGLARTVSQLERVAARLERSTRKPSRTHVSKAARRKPR
jgi:AcrR family transcriptional regulator